MTAIRRATLSITHAGLNTALESLSRGLPMVAIPITNDQPGVASRLAYLGVAEVVPPPRLTVPRLRRRREVLSDPRFRQNARRRQEEIRAVNGVARAADLVEHAVATRRPVLREK